MRRNKLLMVALFMCSAGSLFSQSMQIDGSGITISGNPTEIRYEADLSVTNTTNNDISLLVSQDLSYLTPGHKTNFCWAVCYDTSASVFPDPLTVLARSTDSTSFHSYLYPEGTEGFSTISYTFFDEQNPSDHITASVNFNILTVGISSTENRSSLITSFPNPADQLAGISYSLPSLNNAKLILRDIVGNTVKEFSLNEPKSLLMISTAEFDSGIYTYTLVNAGKSIATKKLIVHHR